MSAAREGRAAPAQPLTIGILGAGKLGTVLARLAVAAGHRVRIAGSGSADRIRLIVDVVTPGAEAVSAEEAVASADLVVLALPLSRLAGVPSGGLAGKVVVDAMNYWWEVDGHRDSLTDPRSSTSELVQRTLPRSVVIKAFNHMGYHDLDEGPLPAGDPNRRAIAVSGDVPVAVAVVASFVDGLGFDPVESGSLHDSIALQPHAEAFGANVAAPDLRAMLERFPTTARGREVAAARSTPTPETRAA